MSKKTMRRSLNGPIVFDPDVYDTLEFACLAWGGIGRGRFYDVTKTGKKPVCLYGLAHAAGVTPGVAYWPCQPIPYISAHASDIAVQRVQGRLGLGWKARVPWTDYVKELNIVRGT